MQLKEIKYLNITSRLFGFELQFGHISLLSFLGEHHCSLTYKIKIIIMIPMLQDYPKDYLSIKHLVWCSGTRCKCCISVDCRYQYQEWQQKARAKGPEAEEMVKWLRVCPTLAEDLDAHNCLQLHLQGIQSLLLATVGTCTHVHASTHDTHK